MEQPVALAEEDQVAGYCHPRVGKADNGIRPGYLSRHRVYRPVNAMIRLARYKEGSCKCAWPEWA
jgi:hypothetical protein